LRPDRAIEDVISEWSIERRNSFYITPVGLFAVSICEHDSIPLNISRVQLDHARQRQRRE
jgi:hypothetical protein